jgi:hypothetical protein
MAEQNHPGIGDEPYALVRLLQFRALFTGFHGLAPPPDDSLLGPLVTRLSQTYPTLVAIGVQNDSPAEVLRCALNAMLPATDMNGLYQQLDTQVRTLEQAAHSPIGGRAHGQVMDGVLPLVDAQLDAVVGEYYRNNQLVPPREPWLGYLKRFRTYRQAADRLGHAYVAANPENGKFVANLSPDEKASLTTWLKAMPVVQRALGGKLGVAVSADAPPRWLDKLDIKTDPDSTYVETESNKLVAASDLPATSGRIATACRRITDLVEPEVLGKLQTPEFFVVRQGAEEHNITVRAYSEGGSIRIHIDQNNEVPVIAHEIGHVLENYLPLDCWLDLQRLLRARHDSKLGAGTLIGIYRGSAECAYQAEMPATGTYSAKFYWTGATECMSMSVEALCTDRKTAADLVEKDPQLAAVVLRWLAPAQFIQFVPNSASEKALPSRRTVG